jgi:hypothetical protein
VPILHARPCWSRFLEFDTSIAGATWWMLAMAMTDLVDVIANPRLLSDLEIRCRANLNGLRGGSKLGALPNGAPPWVYTDEPIDKWSAFSVSADRFPGQSVVADCDDLVGPWGAFWKSRAWNQEEKRWMSNAERRAARLPLGVGVAISQPKLRRCCTGDGCGDRANRLCGHGMAHTYDVLLMPSGFRPACDFGGALVRGDSMLKPQVDGTDEDDSILIPAREVFMQDFVKRSRASILGMDGDLWVWDGSVAAGMKRPSPDFYGSGETSVLWMPDAKLSQLEV